MVALKKAPSNKSKRVYKFNGVEVETINTEAFNGFLINWSAKDMGFGQVFVGWGNKDKLEGYPQQHGFYSDTECMSKEFIKALMKKVAPKMAQIIIDSDRS